MTLRRVVTIAVLIIAGEMVFGLPFHIQRFFRPSVLEAFNLSNTQLGDITAVYGITAMLSYFPGGALADRFSARKLLAVSLFATAVGGFYFSSFPTAGGLALLYGFWGITTIFLFWGALIRSTREWGGTTSQGKAFGILDAGRGLAAALVAAGAALLFAYLVPDSAGQVTDADRRHGLRMVIHTYSLVTVAAGLLVWFVIPDSDSASLARRNPLQGMLEVVRRPVIWAQALIIVCAYCFFKAGDNWSLYARQVLGMSEVDAAKITAAGAYIRPLAALAAGLVADRFDSARTIAALFGLLFVVYLALSFLTPDVIGVSYILGNVAVSLFAVFAFRGVYFALLEETRTPRQVTGAAVGMISVIGFTPEIFMGPVAGRILDATPGVGGHLDLFLVLAGIALVGLLVVWWLVRLKRQILPGGPDSSDTDPASTT
jgi:nitrate/nitrite transporter NarK